MTRHISTGRPPGRPSTINGSATNVFERWQPNRRKTTLKPHAILSSDGQVLFIRSYADESYSPSIIPIQGRPCHVGWYWNGRAFNPGRKREP